MDSRNGAARKDTARELLKRAATSDLFLACTVLLSLSVVLSITDAAVKAVLVVCMARFNREAGKLPQTKTTSVNTP